MPMYLFYTYSHCLYNHSPIWSLSGLSGEISLTSVMSAVELFEGSQDNCDYLTTSFGCWNAWCQHVTWEGHMPCSPTAVDNAKYCTPNISKGAGKLRFHLWR